jgi:uncharacterized Tic20 family protein
MPSGGDYTPPPSGGYTPPGGGYSPGPAPSSGAGGYTPPSSGAGGYTPPSSGAGGYPPPSSGAGGYPPPSSGAGGYPPPQPPPSSGAGGYPPPQPSSGAGGYPPPQPSSGAGGYHTYPSEQAYGAAPGAGYATPGYGAQPGGYAVQPGYGQQPGAYGPPPGYANADDKTYVLIAHWGGVAGVFVGGGFLGWVGPLISYLAKGNVSPTVRAHSVMALNFHITWAIAYVASFLLALVTCGFLFFVPFIAWLIPLIFGIIGSVKATNGEFYRYPMTIPMIK